MGYTSVVVRGLLSRMSMTPKKLQKLAYYVYVWYLVMTGESLFGLRFEAWVHGPVDRNIYNEYKDYGWGMIPQKNTIQINNSVLDYVVSNVIELYGDMDADELEKLTHEEFPWIEARKGIPEYEPCSKVIKDDDIVSYYSTDKNYIHFS